LKTKGANNKPHLTPYPGLAIVTSISPLSPMAEPDRAHTETVITSLLLMGFVFAGVLLAREGPHFDNTVHGGRLFIFAFFGGGIVSFLAWMRFKDVTPVLSLSQPMRQLWLATALAALASATLASYVNRKFATLTDHSRVAAIDQVQEGKGTRWHVVVRGGNGLLERYLITEDAAKQLKGAKNVRYARGPLGFDYIAEFEPVRP
jgi:hypothetical protein